MAAWGIGGMAMAILTVWPILFPQVIAIAPLDSDCDLRQGPCIGTLPEGIKVQFEIQPRSIPVLQPLNVGVFIDGLEVGSVEVDFAGTDMNMGYNRVQLEMVGSGDWQGQVTLPVCLRKRMNWEAKVLLATKLGLMAVPFRFDTSSASSGD
jgi:hypothetical protein